MNSGFFHFVALYLSMFNFQLLERRAACFGFIAAVVQGVDAGFEIQLVAFPCCVELSLPAFNRSAGLYQADGQCAVFGQVHFVAEVLVQQDLAGQYDFL